MTDPAPTAVLTAADSVLIARALGRMPYFPLVHGGGDKMRPRTVADIAATLDAFADVLTRYGDLARQAEEDLRELRSDVAATRRILGLAPVPVPPPR
jgi:hypothetical protein